MKRPGGITAGSCQYSVMLKIICPVDDAHCISVAWFLWCAVVLVRQRTGAGLHAAKTRMRQIVSLGQPSSEAGTCHAPPQHPQSVWHKQELCFCMQNAFNSYPSESAVATTVVVLVGLEENSYKKRYFLVPSSQAKSVHSKCWPQASICLHDMQLLYSYCWLCEMSDNLISVYAVHGMQLFSGIERTAGKNVD